MVRESGMQQLEKDVRAQLMDLEDKVVRVRHSHGLSYRVRAAAAGSTVLELRLSLLGVLCLK